MPYDRPRRPGEDVLKYAVETQRIAASSVNSWQTMMSGGSVSDQFIEGLASPLLPDPQAPAVKPRRAQPVAASAGNDAVTPAMKAKLTAALGLPKTASATQIYAAMDAKNVAKKTAPPTAVAASTPAPLPAVDVNANPAVADIATRHPQMYRDALTASGGAVPALFGTSDLPAITASGIAPQQLAAAHWMARPAIAAATDPAVAQELLQIACGPDADALVHSSPEFAGHPAVNDYLTSVRHWADGGLTVMRQRQQAQQVAAARQQQIAASTSAPDTAEAAYGALFGPIEEREIAYAEEFDRAASNGASVMAIPNARVFAGRRLKAEREGGQ